MAASFREAGSSSSAGETFAGQDYPGSRHEILESPRQGDPVDCAFQVDIYQGGGERPVNGILQGFYGAGNRYYFQSLGSQGMAKTMPGRIGVHDQDS
jgi:hypothetical protein